MNEPRPNVCSGGEFCFKETDVKVDGFGIIIGRLFLLTGEWGVGGGEGGRLTSVPASFVFEEKCCTLADCEVWRTQWQTRSSDRTKPLNTITAYVNDSANTPR